jgi:DNA-binding CsgD family transcriptional regulator
MLIERDRELELITWRLRQARAGRGGALVVEGPAGIGKTALLAAAREVCKGEGFRVLRARGAELERGFAFGAVRQLIEPALAEASESERASCLDGAAGLAARLLGLPGAGPGVGAAAPAVPDPSFAVLHGLYWLCANLAAERPLALIVDDAHWADIASLRFLAFLLPRLEELPLAVLLAARPAEVGVGRALLSAVTMDHASEVVTLGPLSSGAVARMVAEGLGAVPDPGFAAACRDATGGTPFLVGTLVQALREERVAPVAKSAARVGHVATATLGRWAVLQLRRLGPDAASLARAVSVLERCELLEAAGLAELTPGEATRAAGLLVRAGVLHERPLAFAHSVLRAAVYGEIPPAERAEAHRRAARLLAEGAVGVPRVAEHLLAAAAAGDCWVVDQLVAAARAATASGAPDSAAVYLRRALAEPPSPEAEAGLLLELGLAELSAGEAGWEEHLDAAVAAACEDEARVAATLALASALGLHLRCAEAVEVLDRVAAGLESGDLGARPVLEAMAVGLGLLDAATAGLVADRAGALVALARRRAVPPGVRAIAAFVAALANESAEQTAGLARRAIAAGARPALERGEPPWLPNATIALVWTERYGEAQALLDATVAEARAQADGLLLPPALTQRAWLALRRGDLTAAEADTRELLQTPELSAPLLHRLLAIGVLADVLIERGELDEAERTLAPVALDVEGTSLAAGVLRHARGRLRLAQRRFREALNDTLAAGEIATRARALSPTYLPWRSDAALAQLAVGELDVARRLSDEELQLARAFGAPRALGVALRAAGLVAGARRGEPLLREAVEVLSGPDTRLEQARVLVDLGALARRKNQRVEARELLRQALDAAHRAGAAPLADLAETELRATGARPRRVLLTGLESLTACERRIAELAAEGLTNREIAQTLFITARTVEGHLTNVFHKLDISTRTELPAALGRSTNSTTPAAAAQYRG